ncbi:NAD-dependent epimerase/dehydratase family protein [Polymorphobacter arshaanensis]|uniref:NAD-dependent epimerase/dehydratase family protein n=1 Tax=Glacieibacterium arshaanense TaxID=2511025 RepID=A0A4Y9EP03_9SPHN|nr:NAD-dependent epimerase/dehydratase family protein [Polymorphobacter arshaanensis]TFU03782.1 NAD-dependent epimerase/dehydratase family protein [Polymorphobacter arshaanensis]
MAILVTGAAGFIGFHVAQALLARGESVVGIDNFNSYYPVSLKRDRIAALVAAYPDFTCIEGDFGAEGALSALFGDRAIDRIIHLGAQAGVRYSIEAPFAYARSNLIGHLEVLEYARARQVRHLVYASSSSVYGGNSKLPFAVEDRVDHPVSLYAATKKADELMSESYAHLYRIPQTGLRFFTVYGPWGRPDMAPWLFTDAILAGRPIRLFNHGNVRRDFTYIDDIVAGVIGALDHVPADDGAQKPGGSKSPHAIYNLGNEVSEPVSRLVEAIEAACGREAVTELVPMQPGDVEGTHANIDVTRRNLGFSPRVGLDAGIARFVDWFRRYHGV